MITVLKHFITVTVMKWEFDKLIAVSNYYFKNLTLESLMIVFIIIT